MREAQVTSGARADQAGKVRDFLAVQCVAQEGHDGERARFMNTYTPA